MRKGWVVGVIAGLVFIATPAITVAAVIAGSSSSESPAAATLRPAAEPDDEPETETDESETDEKGEGAGPPPWAQAHKADKGLKGHGKDAAWKREWKKLTPAQRAARMEALGKEHAAGMRAFARCMAAAEDSAENPADRRAERRACVKPLPPGLAKKR